ncbi:MAG: acetyltransferase [Acidimicrobiales bacterium]
MAELTLVDRSGGPHAYIYGAGGHAHVVATVLEDLGIEVVGMFEDHPERSHPLSDKMLPGIVELGERVLLDHPVVLGVGDNTVRQTVAGLIGSRFLTAVHPSALIAKRVTIGTGTVVLQGSVIQHNTKLGEHVLINTSASVDHDNVIGDFAHISPNATLCGHVVVGEGSHVGAGATLLPSIRVGKWATVGAGAVVTEDVPDFATVVGVPARVIKYSPLGDRIATRHESSG